MYSESRFFPMGLSGKDSAADTAKGWSPLRAYDLGTYLHDLLCAIPLMPNITQCFAELLFTSFCLSLAHCPSSTISWAIDSKP